MQLIEKHIVKYGTVEFREIDDMAFLSKNLYNTTLYSIRQHFFNTSKYLSYASICKTFAETHNPDYEAMPRKVSQATMKLVDTSFRSFFKSLASYKKHPEKFKGRPRIPKYLDKTNGRFCLTFTSQAISKRELDKNHVIVPSGLDIKIPTLLSFADINCVRIVKKTGAYVVEIIYHVNDVEIKPDNGKYMGIDLGIGNFATITSNVNGVAPVIIRGGNIKSYNRYYNKKVSELRSILETRNKRKTSRRIERLGLKRENKINDYLHKSSRIIVNQAVSDGVNTIIVGNNKGWKQGANIGKVNNQNFAGIPYYKFINMLRYKCTLSGLTLLIQEESYTSKCSFLDGEDICKHECYVGKRRHRGLFLTRNGEKINADVNGSYNIIRKCKPKAFVDGVEAVVVQPRIIKILN